MADYATTTSLNVSGTLHNTFVLNTKAFDALIAQLHVALEAEALVVVGYHDIALSSLAHDAATAWATCETSAMHFLCRPELDAPHVQAAEHLLDVLCDGGADRDALLRAPNAVAASAARCAVRGDFAGRVMSRQLCDLAGILRLIIADSAPCDIPDLQRDEGLEPDWSQLASV